MISNIVFTAHIVWCGARPRLQRVVSQKDAHDSASVAVCQSLRANGSMQVFSSPDHVGVIAGRNTGFSMFFVEWNFAFHLRI
jgi:hypothetical protein